MCAWVLVCVWLLYSTTPGVAAPRVPDAQEGSIIRVQAPLQWSAETSQEHPTQSQPEWRPRGSRNKRDDSEEEASHGRGDSQSQEAESQEYRARSRKSQRDRLRQRNRERSFYREQPPDSAQLDGSNEEQDSQAQESYERLRSRRRKLAGKIHRGINVEEEERFQSDQSQDEENSSAEESHRRRVRNKGSRRKQMRGQNGRRRDAEAKKRFDSFTTGQSQEEENSMVEESHERVAHKTRPRRRQLTEKIHKRVNVDEDKSLFSSAARQLQEKNPPLDEDSYERVTQERRQHVRKPNKQVNFDKDKSFYSRVTESQEKEIPLDEDSYERVTQERRQLVRKPNKQVNVDKDKSFYSRVTRQSQEKEPPLAEESHDRIIQERGQFAGKAFRQLNVEEDKSLYFSATEQPQEKKNSLAAEVAGEIAQEGKSQVQQHEEQKEKENLPRHITNEEQHHSTAKIGQTPPRQDSTAEPSQQSVIHSATSQERTSKEQEGQNHEKDKSHKEQVSNPKPSQKDSTPDHQSEKEYSRRKLPQDQTTLFFQEINGNPKVHAQPQIKAEIQKENQTQQDISQEKHDNNETSALREQRGFVVELQTNPVKIVQDQDGLHNKSSTETENQETQNVHDDHSKDEHLFEKDKDHNEMKEVKPGKNQSLSEETQIQTEEQVEDVSQITEPPDHSNGSFQVSSESTNQTDVLKQKDLLNSTDSVDEDEGYLKDEPAREDPSQETETKTEADQLLETQIPPPEDSDGNEELSDQGYKEKQPNTTTTESSEVQRDEESMAGHLHYVEPNFVVTRLVHPNVSREADLRRINLSRNVMGMSRASEPRTLLKAALGLLTGLHMNLGGSPTSGKFTASNTMSFLGKVVNTDFTISYGAPIRTPIPAHVPAPFPFTPSIYNPHQHPTHVHQTPDHNPADPQLLLGYNHPHPNVPYSITHDHQPSATQDHIPPDLHGSQLPVGYSPYHDPHPTEGDEEYIPFPPYKTPHADQAVWHGIPVVDYSQEVQPHEQQQWNPHTNEQHRLNHLQQEQHQQQHQYQLQQFDEEQQLEQYRLRQLQEEQQRREQQQEGEEHPPPQEEHAEPTDEDHTETTVDDVTPTDSSNQTEESSTTTTTESSVTSRDQEEERERPAPSQSHTESQEADASPEASFEYLDEGSFSEEEVVHKKNKHSHGARDLQPESHTDSGEYHSSEETKDSEESSGT